MSKEVITVSDSVFFVKTIDAPVGLSPKDCPEFADTAAETISPLPMEKLRRGYILRRGSITIFAGLDERIFGTKSDGELVGALAVIPSSALLLFADFEDSNVFFSTKESIALIEIQGGKWKNFNALKSSDNLEEDAKKLANVAGLSQADISKAKFCRLVSCVQMSRKKISFTLEIGDNFQEHGNLPKKTYTIATSAIITGDLRDKSILKTSETSKRKEGICLFALKSIPAIFILLALLQVGVWLKQRSFDSLKNGVDKIEPSAKLVEMQSEHAAQLSVFNGKKLRGIETLALVNSVRPSSITFSRIVQTEPLSIELQGLAPSVGIVDSYVKSLLKLESISGATPKTEVSRGVAKFTISVRLK